MNIYLVTLFTWFIIINIYLKGQAVGSNRFKTSKKLLDMRKKIGISFVFVFGFVMGFRSVNVGTDTLAYSNMFLGIARSSDIFKHYMFRKAPVYVVLCKILSFISLEQHFLIAFISFVIVICNVVFIYYESDDMVLSLYLYIALDCYMPAFNIARQSLAMAVVLMAYLLLEREKTKGAAVCLLMAVGIHQTAIIGFLMIPLFMIKVKGTTALFFTLGTIIAELASVRLISVFISIFTAYSKFDSSGFSITAPDSAGNRAYIALVFIIIEFWGIYLTDSDRKDGSRENFLRMLCFANVGVFSMIINRYYYVFARIEKYFIQILIILIPMVYSKSRIRYNRIIASFATYAVFLVPYILKLSYYLPYSFMWQE